MIPCDESCQLYFKCNARGIKPTCVFDMGIGVKGEEGDEFLEKITY